MSKQGPSVIDRGKGLRAAVNSVFGALRSSSGANSIREERARPPPPKHMHTFVAKKIERVYRMADFDEAKRLLQALARTLDAQHPGAARGMFEAEKRIYRVQRYRAPRSRPRFVLVSGR